MKSGLILKQFKSKKGNDVIIRYSSWNDLEPLLSFANAISRENTFIMMSGEYITRFEEMNYLSEQLKGVEDETRIHLVALVNGTLAANCGIYRKRMRSHHVGDIHISISKEYRKEGIGTILLETLKEEAKKIDIKLLTLTCFEKNEIAIHVYEKVGFKKIGVIPGMYKKDDVYENEAVMYCEL
jgi:RimJ/RimL family protein N-acetyltransferase